MIQSYVHMSRLVRLARVAGGAAVEAGEHAGGAAHGGGVDAAHGARDGQAGADVCLLYTSPSPRDGLLSRMPSSA